MRPRSGRGPLLVVGLALVGVLAALWLFARPLSDIDRSRRHFAELQRQFVAARQTKGARAADRGRVMRLRAQARMSNGAQRESYEREASAAEAQLGWGNREALRSTLLASPLLAITRAAAPSDVVPVFSGSAGPSHCVACHVGIATPGFERYPLPFRTHPALDAYVGAASPHPPSRVGCTSCHQGDEYAETFNAAGHTRADLPAGVRAERAAPALAWAVAGATGAMLPSGLTEAACVSCHQGERYQPGALALNAALVTVERAGCYGCHVVPGMEQTAKRGPDLRRIRGKLTPAWVRRWLADPRAVKPATWMPQFWTAPEVLPVEQRAEIEAVVAYLFDASTDYAPAAPAPRPGDASRGQQRLASVGCLGCHVVGDASRDKASVRRTFGQPLQSIGDKVTYAWLVDWLREPSRYSPGTRMPNLRLTAAEAADVATYLGTLVSPPSSPPGSPLDDDGPFGAVLTRYGGTGASASAALSGAVLRVAAGKAVISTLGCFNCHDIAGFEGRRTRVPVPVRANWTTDGVLKLHQAPRGAPGLQGATTTEPGNLPRVAGRTEPGPSLGPTEVSRMRLAMTALAGPIREAHALSTPWHQTKVAGRTLVQERNCVGCHAVDGVGGDFVSLVAEPTLGPPLLTPEGARVQPAWLRGFLRQPAPIRPWLAVRMPTFGLADEDVESVGNYFRAVAPENPKPTPAPPGATAAAGAELFTLLKCQQCHVLGTIPADQPTSNLAPDLRMARARLEPEWILAWLRNPSAILPGTRMPSFWPDYPKSFYQPLGKEGTAQVRALREHLLTLR